MRKPDAKPQVPPRRWRRGALHAARPRGSSRVGENLSDLRGQLDVANAPRLAGGEREPGSASDPPAMAARALREGRIELPIS